MRVKTDRTAWDQMPVEYENSPCANCDTPGGILCDDCGGVEWESGDEFYEERLEKEEEKRTERARVFVSTTLSGPGL